METTNSHHSLSDTNLSTDLMEEERKLWAAEKKSFQQQIQVIYIYTYITYTNTLPLHIPITQMDKIRLYAHTFYITTTGIICI